MRSANDNSHITPTPAALELARKFRRELKEQDASKEWVIGFSWAIERRMREPKGGPMRNLGPGLELRPFERREVPAAQLRSGGEFDYLIDIPAAVAADASLIDLDGTQPSRLTLR
jgi:hypothetical protein